MTYCKQLCCILLILMLILFFLKKLKELRDTISGISIKLYSIQLKTHLMQWNIEFVEKKFQVLTHFKTLNLSSKSKFNLMEIKSLLILHCRKSKSQLIVLLLQFLDAQSTYTIGINRIKTQMIRQHSTIWLLVIKKLSRLFCC